MWYALCLALIVVLVERAQDELADGVQLRLWRRLGPGAAEDEPDVREHGADAGDERHQTGHGHGGHGTQHGDQGADERRLHQLAHVQRLERADRVTDDGAQDLLGHADRLQQSDQAGLQQSGALVLRHQHDFLRFDVLLVRHDAGARHDRFLLMLRLLLLLLRLQLFRLLLLL